MLKQSHILTARRGIIPNVGEWLCLKLSHHQEEGRISHPVFFFIFFISGMKPLPDQLPRPFVVSVDVNRQHADG